MPSPARRRISISFSTVPKRTYRVRIGQPPLRVDLLRAIDGVPTAEVFRNAVSGRWDGLPIRLIALEDLITNKTAAARPQDLADVRSLERVRSKQPP